MRMILPMSLASMKSSLGKGARRRKASDSPEGCDLDGHVLQFAQRRVVAGRLASHVHKIIAKSRVGKTGSCHIFRHTFATLMLENGCDIRHIQSMLGHAKLETTAIYIHLNMRDLKTAHDKYHPAKLGSEDRRNVGVLFGDEKEQLFFPFATAKTLQPKRHRITMGE